jgi:hypothetical protein
MTFYSKNNNKRKGSRKSKGNNSKKVMSLIQPEYKRYYLTYSKTSIVIPGVQSSLYTPINLISQGTTATTRLGNKILIKVISINFDFLLAGEDMTQIRFILFMDRQCNGDDTSIDSKLLSDTDSEDILVANYNVDNRNRFKVLHDELINLDVYHAFKRTRRSIYPNVPIHYSGTAASLSDVTQNCFYVLFAHNAPTTNPQLIGQITVRFTDA